LESAQGIISIESSTYGSLQVKTDQVFHFPQGIIGLPEHHEYALIPIEGSPFYIFHAVDGDVSFILVESANAVRPYDFTIDKEVVQVLSVAAPEDVTTYSIVNMLDDRIVANLKAPVLLASQHRKGCQYVILDKDYPIRFPLSLKENEYAGAEAENR